jgi:hypothetical protein
MSIDIRNDVERLMAVNDARFFLRLVFIAKRAKLEMSLTIGCALNE